MPAIVPAALLLTASNVFMTFAWYAHLKNFADKPWFIAALVSWGIAPFAFFYMRQPLKLDYLWAAQCMPGAVFFIFRAPGTTR